MNTERDSSVLKRIATLERQIDRIDECALKVKFYQEFAKQSLTSLNLLTIEARPGYRVNIGRLKKWAMLINPLIEDDPYAKRVYIVSKCDELYLSQKRSEFVERVKELRASIKRPEETTVETAQGASTVDTAGRGEVKIEEK